MGAPEMRLMVHLFVHWVPFWDENPPGPGFSPTDRKNLASSGGAGLYGRSFGLPKHCKPQGLPGSVYQVLTNHRVV